MKSQNRFFWSVGPSPASPWLLIPTLYLLWLAVQSISWRYCIPFSSLDLFSSPISSQRLVSSKVGHYRYWQIRALFATVRVALATLVTYYNHTMQMNSSKQSIAKKDDTIFTANIHLLGNRSFIFWQIMLLSIVAPFILIILMTKLYVVVAHVMILHVRQLPSHVWL